MTWFRVDDKLHDHPKFRKLRSFKLAALGLWTACGSWSADNLSDGFVPAEIVQRFDPDEGLAKRLVEVRLWEHAEHDGEDGYRFHEWTDHQPTREDVEKRRADARERMRKLRGSRTGSHDVRANSERSSLNAFARTSANTSDDPHDSTGEGELYTPSKESVQVQPPVRANSARSSKTVRDTRPDPSLLEETNTVTAAASTTRKDAAKAAVDAEFETWWQTWPRKVAKQAALKAYRTARKKVTLERLLEAATEHAESWKLSGRPTEKIPHAATWLNDERWNDEIERPKFRVINNPDSPWNGYQLDDNASPWSEWIDRSS